MHLSQDKKATDELSTRPWVKKRSTQVKRNCGLCLCKFFILLFFSTVIHSFIHILWGQYSGGNISKKSQLFLGLDTVSNRKQYYYYYGSFTQDNSLLPTSCSQFLSKFLTMRKPMMMKLYVLLLKISHIPCCYCAVWKPRCVTFL